MAGSKETLPRAFGQYTLLKKLGQGGMAEVLLARQEGIEGTSRLVAIKRVHPSLSLDDEFVTMFLDEVRIAQVLGHPNIGHTLDVGKIEGRHYIAMEYVQGRDLVQVLRAVEAGGARMPPEVAVEVGRQICAALDYAHRRTAATGRPLNIVHRDVSPDNVILTFDGTVKLMDFGIALAENRVSRTRAGLVKGKPPYMAPEQILGSAVDGRTDVFALGALLYRACCRTHPFSASNPEKIFRRVLDDDPPAPARLVPELPADLSGAIMMALAKDPTLRPDARALSDALDEVVVRNGLLMTPRRLAGWLAEVFPAAAQAHQRFLESPDDALAAATASYLSSADLLEVDEVKTTRTDGAFTAELFPGTAAERPAPRPLPKAPAAEPSPAVDHTVPDRPPRVDPEPTVPEAPGPGAVPAASATPAPAAPQPPREAPPPADPPTGSPLDEPEHWTLEQHWAHLPPTLRSRPALAAFGAVLALLLILAGLGVRSCL